VTVASILNRPAAASGLGYACHILFRRWLHCLKTGSILVYGFVFVGDTPVDDITSGGQACSC
jgi:hypothetical protein